MNKYFIVGASGFAQEVTEYLIQDKIEISGYFDTNNNDYKKYAYQAPFLGSENNFEFTGKEKIIIAISDPTLRKKIYLKLKSYGCLFPNFIYSNCFISSKIKIGEGGLICPFTTITSNAKIGNNFHANIYSYIAHDCIIGDNVTFAPNVQCNGNIHIGDSVYIGAGATLKQGSSNKPLLIGEGATIGMGAVVTKDVPAGQTVVGNPAKLLQKLGV